MKKFVGMICAIMILSLTLSACGSDPAPAPTPGNPTAPVVEPSGEPSGEPSAPVDPAPSGSGGATTASEGKIQAPIIVTTCGQSPGSVMINMVAVQGGFTSTNDNTLSSEAFEAGDAKSLIVTTGTSMKGMGAAGTDVDSEIARCEALIQTAKDAGLTIVGAHVEGMARRTDNSDQRSIDSVLALCDVILVVEESDSDGYFTDYAAENNKPLIVVKDALEIASVLE